MLVQRTPFWQDAGLQSTSMEDMVACLPSLQLTSSVGKLSGGITGALQQPDITGVDTSQQGLVSWTQLVVHGPSKRGVLHT